MGRIVRGLSGSVRRGGFIEAELAARRFDVPVT
jgi:hypothetical protein